MRIRSWALCGAAGLFVSGQALADDRSINTAVTVPVETSDPAGTGGTPGNITIEGGSGSVTINAPGAAVTIDSNNTVTNNGAINNQSTTDAVGIHILGGFTGNLLDADGRPIGLTGTGAISLLGTGADGLGTPGTGNIGVLLDGPGSFTGDIDLHSMFMTVHGIDAAGVEIDTGLTGNLVLGNTAMFGPGASALRTTAAITGSVTNTSLISVQGPSTFDTTAIDPVAGPALAIGADVTGGILNAGPTSDTDVTTVAASIQSAGSSPTIEISPAGPAAADLTIGIFDDTTNPGFSFINRGSISSAGVDPGVNATTIEVKGDGTHTATLTGGLYNRGMIRADATTGTANATALTQDELDAIHTADATAIRIGAGGVLPTIVNDVGGTIMATTQDGPKGGTAVAVLIEAGGSLTSLVNNGALSAFAGTTDPTMTEPLRAITIWDQSGSLTSVTNTGNIAAGANILSDGTQVVLAADFSANTTTLTFTNSGTVAGDIVFGAGSNQFTIDGDVALATGSYHAATGGTLDIDVVKGTLATTDTQAHNLDVGGDGILAVKLPDTSGGPPFVTLTGSGNFTAGSHVTLAYTKFLGDSANFVVVHADGALSFDDLAASTDATRPFLYNTTFANDGHDLTLDIARKTAGQLGFSGNLEAVYEPVIAAVVAATAADTDTQLGVALMGLTDAASTATAFQSLIPTVNGAQRNYAIALTDQSFGPVGARQRALVTTPNQGRNLAFWGQEFYLSNRNDGSATMPGYADSGFGVAFGADYGSLSTGRYGVAFEHFNGDSVEGEPRITKTINDWTVFSLYGNWADSDTGLYFGTQGTFALGSFDEKRRIQVGPYTPTAQGHWTGWMTAGGMSVGDVIGDDTFAIIPQADIDALYMHESAYNERGAGAANLAVSDRSSTSLRGFLGLVGRAQFEFAGGYVRPELHVGWSQEFAGHPADANVYFISAQNMHFRISGPAEPAGRLIGGGSLSFVYNNWSVGTDYDRTLGSATSSEAGSVTVTGHF